MLVCQEIVQAFDRSLQPYRVKQATYCIESLRKNENYIVSILQILLKSEEYPSINQLQLITELKTMTHITKLTENQISTFYNSFIKIIHKRANKGTHKMLRQVVKNLIIKDYQNWFNFQQFQQFIKNDVGGSKYYKRWMLSIAIGIPEACRFKTFSKQSQKYIQKYDNLIHQIWPRINQFEMYQIHYILKFLYKCIQCSSISYSEKLMKKFLKMVLQIGQYFFKKDYFVSDQPSQPSKAAKYLLRLLRSCFMKHREHGGPDKNFYMEMWSQSNKDVVALFNTLFNRISKEHPFIGQTCEKQILLESIYLINQYFSVIKPENIDEKIQKLLYVDIPRMLFNLRSIVECSGVNLQSIEKSLNNQSFRLKKSLLRLWRSLNCLDLEFNTKQAKLDKNCKSTRDISNCEHNQKPMSGLLHIKFVFQKLTETKTFFSPFQKRRKLNNQKIWNFQSNQEWIIVAFDLFRVLASDIIKGENCLQNMRISISDILQLYVLPKIVHKNALIQSHAIAVLVTYQFQFENLKISKEILTNLSHILSPNTQNAEENAVKNTLFCCLPLLKNNWQIRDLIRDKIENIFDYYQQRLQDQQEHNYEVAKAFSNIIQYYSQSIEDPQKHLNGMIKRIIEVQKKRNIDKISLYMDCIEKFISSMQNTDQIGSSILKLFNFSLYLASYETDQLLVEEILCCIKAYVKKMRVLTQQSICMFVIYCVYMCHHSDQILSTVKQIKGYERIKKYCKYQKRETHLDQSILYIVQYFSVHQKFYSISRFIGSQPYQFYFHALEACVKFYRQKSEVEEYGKIYFFNEIIKGLIAMVEYMFENISNSQLIIGKIWLFSNLQIFQPYKKQLLNFFDAPWQTDPNLVIYYQQFVKNLAQLWAISTAYFPEAIQQIIESDYNFLLYLILLVKSCKKNYQQEKFRCTVFCGFQQLLNMPKVKKNELEAIINLIVVIVQQQEKNSRKFTLKQWRAQQWRAQQHSEEDDSFYEEDFIEDSIYNEIRRDQGPHQQFEYIDQIIDMIKFRKKGQVSKYQTQLKVLYSYKQKLMAQILVLE